MERSDVIVTGFRLNAAAPPARVLQTLLGLSEPDAKALSKRFPCVVLADVEWAEAERVSLALRDAGAYAKLRTAGAKSEPPGPADVPKTLPPAELEVARIAPRSQPAPAPGAAAPATPVVVAAATVEPVPAAPALTAPLRMAPAAQATFDLGHAPTLFSAPRAAEPHKESPRASLPYALGELEIVPSKSMPAPALAAAGAPPKAVQAAPSQPAPAATTHKSQPAPAINSQPAAASAKAKVEATGLHMLDDGFGGESPDGPALELDYGSVKVTGRVEIKPRAKVSVPEKAKPRGFWATLLLPFVLIQAAVPHALAFTGVAAATGVAVYFARTSASDTAGEDDAPLAEEGKASAAPATGATHPLVKLAPKAMEPAIASILRRRIRGLHKVNVTWPEGEAPKGSPECVLLEQEHAGNLKLLLSTGRAVSPPAAVRNELWDHIATLRAANGDPRATFIPICLAN